MNREYQDMLEGFLREGDEDDIGLWQITTKISRLIGVDEFKISASDSEKLLSAVLDFVPVMLQNGFSVMSVEHNEHGKELVAWPDQSPKYVVDKIRSEWLRLEGMKPNINFIAYFDKIDKRPAKRRR